MCLLGWEHVVFPHSRYNRDAITVYKAMFYLYDKHEGETLPGYMELRNVPQPERCNWPSSFSNDSESVVDSEMRDPSIASTELDYSDIEDRDQVTHDVTMGM